MSSSMRDRMNELAELELPEKRQRFQQVMAGVEVALSERGRGFKSLTEVIDIGMAVSDEMQSRERMTKLAEDTRRQERR